MPVMPCPTSSRISPSAMAGKPTLPRITSSYGEWTSGMRASRSDGRSASSFCAGSSR
ncbi:MAG: hypothetical protein IPJ34_30495 [Myxococcales bacterium]|nr:hypothetical protein [Myxococcales bacterium]